MPRLSLLLLTAVVAGTAMVGNAMGLAAAEPEAAPQTRLGAAIGADIGVRDKAANRRTRALDMREQAVRAAEVRLKGEAVAPAPAAGDAGAAAPGAPAAPDQYDNLARIYQAMKPPAAALVLEQLDLDVQRRVAEKMRERSTAMILAAMTPKGAARLTMALAGRRGPTPVAPSSEKM